ncbi:MAG: hypothetical protein KKI09_02580 [Spirochaetes bacterium]|nr:hypothetical protein [Spirochaetota bacterium]MBU0954291.1 hypothetical protein [Spirochaetota bacterium]
MKHPKTVEWFDRLKVMFDEIDHYLEDKYSGRWQLRRNRPERGQTANPEADGLFNVGVFFDPGFGSQLGRGYLVEIVLATEEQLPPEERNAIRDEVRGLLQDLLPRHFPERKLDVDLDGRMLKIHGDLSLGQV